MDKTKQALKAGLLAVADLKKSSKDKIIAECNRLLREQQSAFSSACDRAASLQDQNAELERQRDVLKREAEQKNQLYHEVRARNVDLEDQINKVRSQFSDLKQRLHFSEIENARLRGIVERVHEEDHARQAPRGTVQTTEALPAQRPTNAGQTNADRPLMNWVDRALEAGHGRHWTGLRRLLN